MPLLSWFDSHGRKDLPWQHPRTAYRVWISEIMLQQTQVKTAIPYFNRFMAIFPDIRQLAKAKEDHVLAIWSGLGYYSRARNICKTAVLICQDHQGIFPRTLEELTKLPGIGNTTAAAILSQTFNLPAAILDGNVKRILCRYFLIDGWPYKVSVKQKLWQLADQCMSKKRCADYTQAIMDLGATCCRPKADCPNCPLQKTCLAHRQQKVAQYPFKKIKSKLPTRQQQFLLLYTTDKKIYLEKRPPTGLWGSLWCLPAIENSASASDYLSKTLALTCLKTDELINIKHSFSHFHLQIKASAMLISMNKSSLAENPGKWLKKSEIRQLGIAKPVAVIISHFFTMIEKKNECFIYSNS